MPHQAALFLPPGEISGLAVPDHLCLSTDVQAANGQIYRERAMARPLLPHGMARQASRWQMS